jgi:hypothetical protein
VSTFRFGLVVFGLFTLIFVGGSWAMRGFPIMAIGIVPLKPDSRIPTFEQAVKESIRKNWVNSKTNQGDGNAERDKLRLELLQAANAYKLSPCGDLTRKNLIEAMTNYTKAWYDAAFCRLGVDGCPSTTDERFDAAVVAFNTPADVHMHQALQAAMRKGGISREDFPSEIRRHAFVWSGAPLNEPREACLVARMAASRR